MFQNASLQMQWCLDCHRNPAKNVRPREEVFNMNWNPSDRASFLKYMPSPREASNPHWEPAAKDVARLQAKLAKDYDAQIVDELLDVPPLGTRAWAGDPRPEPTDNNESERT